MRVIGFINLPLEAARLWAEDADTGADIRSGRYRIGGKRRSNDTLLLA
jgi:hypothetical protein